MASNSTSESARRSSKRVSTLPSSPKAPTSIDPSAIVANHAILTGLYPITIGPRVVLHPYARVVSGDGPIEIGEGCIIWEKAVVGSGSAVEDDSKRTEQVKKIVLGPNVVVESGAVVEAESVGEGTIIEPFSKLGDGANVGKFCKVVPYASVEPNAAIPDFTIVLGASQQRQDTTMSSNPLVRDIKSLGHKKHLKALQVLIPSNVAKWQ